MLAKTCYLCCSTRPTLVKNSGGYFRPAAGARKRVPAISKAAPILWRGVKLANSLLLKCNEKYIFLQTISWLVYHIDQEKKQEAFAILSAVQEGPAAAVLHC